MQNPLKKLLINLFFLQEHVWNHVCFEACAIEGYSIEDAADIGTDQTLHTLACSTLTRQNGEVKALQLKHINPGLHITSGLHITFSLV